MKTIFELSSGYSNFRSKESHIISLLMMLRTVETRCKDNEYNDDYYKISIVSSKYKIGEKALQNNKLFSNCEIIFSREEIIKWNFGTDLFDEYPKDEKLLNLFEKTLKVPNRTMYYFYFLVENTPTEFCKTDLID